MKTLAFRNIARRKKRNFLIILGIGIGIASFIIFSSISYEMIEKTKMTYSIKEEIKISKRGGISYDEVKSIEHIPHVEVVSPIILKGVNVEAKEESYSVLLRMIDPEKEFKVRDWELISGRWLLSSDSDAVVIGSRLSTITEKGVGEVIKIEGERYRIVGIIESSVISISTSVDSLVNIPLEYGVLTSCSEVIVKADSIDSVDNIVESAKNRVHGAEILVGKNLVSEKVIWSIRLIPLIISGAAVLVSFFMIVTSLLTSVYERTREIGVIKAIGATHFHVLKIFILESFLFGLFASLSGIVLVYLFDFGLTLVWKQFINPEMPLSFYYIPIPVVIAAILLGIGTSVIAGSYPAFKAARLNIIDALRYE